METNRPPINHPNYSYPISPNPYWKKLKDLESKVFIDNDSEKNPGSWKSNFKNNPEKLHVEIGCNAGHWLLGQAMRNPGDAFLGIDWKFKQIFRGFEKTVKHKISNALFIRAHAERIHFIFAKNEIDFLYLFFPDPWPKKKHLKNRLVNPTWLKNVAEVVKKNGTFHIKTDHGGYYESMRKTLEEVTDIWEITHVDEDLHRNHPDPTSLSPPDITLFEKIFIKDGKPVRSIELTRL